jgi:predicted ATPase/DNA-binding CsgD family transcriptional regulator
MTLSNRERQVAFLVRDGLTDREISQKLVISLRTAEWHVEQIFNKLGLTSRAQVAVWAERHAMSTEGGNGEPALNALHNLPLQLTSFVGRRHEIAHIQELLSNTRLLTITGVAGVGKTRLALMVAERLVEQHVKCRDGVWVVELAGLSDPRLVAQNVASALGIRERVGRPIQDTVIEQLKPRQLVLVLDNCEHLIEGCADVVEGILRACPQVMVLATSREVLHVPGERTWRVPSMALPDAALTEVGSIASSEAVELFVARARQAAAGFAITQANAAAVSNICQRLDGIPLAIELAAAKVPALTPEQIVVRLDQRFLLLTGGSRSALARQRTLKAAIDWSYELLTDDERVLFRRLSVFAGSLDLEAAEAVCAGTGLEEPVLATLLASLVDKSLVVTIAGIGEQRYRLLESLREYARDRLNEASEMVGIQDAFLRHFVAIAEELARLMLSEQAPTALIRLGLEEDNLRTAIDLTVSNRPDLALRLCIAMSWYWSARSHWSEGNQTITKTLNADSGNAELRALAYCRRAIISIYSGDEASSLALADESVAVARKAKSALALIQSLFGRGWMFALAGRIAEAHADIDEAHQVATDAGIASPHPTLGATMLEASENNISAALTFRDALRKSNPGPLFMCIAEAVVGVAAAAAGDVAIARSELTEALTLSRSYGFRWYGGVAMAGAALIEAQEGRPGNCWWLIGAAAHLRDGAPQYFSRPGYNRILAACRGELSQEFVEATMAHGARAIDEQAYTQALELLAPPADLRTPAVAPDTRPAC